MFATLSVRRLITVLLLVVCLLALNGCGQQALPPQHVPGDPRAGLSAFKFEGCASCHTIAGVSVGTSGPALNGEGAKRSASWLRTLLPGHLRAMHSPPFPARDHQDLLSYLLSLR